MQNVLLVGIGGFFGAITRYLTTKYTAHAFGSFPLGTLLVNIAGSFVLGFLMYSFLSDSRLVTPELRSFMAVGFIGALTTMSTFAYETVRLIELKDYMLFGLNLGGNILLCLLAVYLGKLVSQPVVELLQR